MAITAASVEANGWVLRVTLTAALSSAVVAGFNAAYATPGQAPDVPAQWATNFSAYALAPNGVAPALTLAATTGGFVQSNGTAIASSAVPRTLIATKALRKPVDATPNPVTRRPKLPDEVDNGDGTITVRIALSHHVYAGDSGLSLTALAGWRIGAGAQTIAVTNNSTVPAPAPIVRWADAPYQLRSAAFPLEVVVASHHPNGVAPVAGVRFTVTDGTTVKSYWATALTTSAAYPATNGDGTANLPLRVYAATVDPTTATALTKGLLRCDFEVYPWVGPVQKSDAAGTRSMTSLGTAASVTSAFAPFVVAWNPGNSWIVPRYAYVDPVGGSATAAAANVSTSAAAAALTPLQTPNLAIESLRLWSAANAGSGGTLAAANGQAAIPQSVDGCRVRLVAGVTVGMGTSVVTSGAQCAATHLVIEGDPANANPRAACILRSPGTANGSSRISRFAFANLSVEAQTNAVCGAATAWLNNVEVRGVAGQTTTTGVPFGATGGLLWATNVKWWQHGTGLVYSGSQITMLARSCQVERPLSAPVVVNCARLPSATAALPGFVSPLTLTDAGLALERLAIGNDLRFLNGQQMGINTAYLATASAPASLQLGTTYPVMARVACLNNVGEAYGASQTLWSSVGENGLVAFSEVIVEGNTLTGDRTNNPYGTGADVTIALTDAASPQLRLFRFANNITMKNANKHDRYNDQGIAGGVPTGIVGSAGVSKRTWGRVGATLGTALTRNWAVAVGDELVIAGSPANVYHCTTAGTTAATGGPTGTGTGIADGTAVWAWVATEARIHGYRSAGIGMWASNYGVGYEGNIDVQGPAGPSYDPEFFFDFYGVGANQLSQDGVDVGSDPFTVDKSGTANKLAFQATPDGTGGGNYQPLATGAGTYILGRARTANVDTDQTGVARAAVFAAGAIEGLASVIVTPAGDRQATRAASGVVGWTTTLVADGDRSGSRAAPGGVAWQVVVAPDFTRSPMRAATPAVTAAGPSPIVPASGRIAIVDPDPPAAMTTPPERTLFVAGDGPDRFA